jgi:hypothetical protein
MRLDGLIEMDGRTAGCTLSLGMEGDLNDGVADMGIIEGLTPDLVCPLHHLLDRAEKVGGTSDPKGSTKDGGI